MMSIRNIFALAHTWTIHLYFRHLNLLVLLPCIHLYSRHCQLSENSLLRKQQVGLFWYNSLCNIVLVIHNIFLRVNYLYFERLLAVDNQLPSFIMIGV